MGNQVWSQDRPVPAAIVVVIGPMARAIVCPFSSEV
jgi:hypothetical protein